MTSTAIPLELALQVVIRQQMDAIVYTAEKDAALLEGSGMDKSQLQNVLNVAEESHSLAVVANFIRYQIGRARIGPTWQHQDFGQCVVTQISDPDGVIHQQTAKVMETLQTRLAPEGVVLPEGAVDRVQYELMRYYLGYLIRAYVYGNSGVKHAWAHLRESAEAS